MSIIFNIKFFKYIYFRNTNFSKLIKCQSIITIQLINLYFKNLKIIIIPVINDRIQDSSFIFFQDQAYPIILNNITFENISGSTFFSEFIVKGYKLTYFLNLIIEKLIFNGVNFAESFFLFLF